MKFYGVWSESEGWWYEHGAVFCTRYYAIAVAQAMVVARIMRGSENASWGAREIAYIKPDCDNKSADSQERIGKLMRQWGGQKFWTNLHVQEQRLFVRRLLECVDK